MIRLSVLVIAFLASSCASSPERSELVAEAQKEPQLEGSAQIRERLIQLVQQDPDLPEIKKQSVTSIISEVYDSNHSLQVLFNQKKSLYVKELLKPEFDRKKTQSIASSLETINRTQMKNLLNGVSKIKKELGLEAVKANRVFNQLFDGGGRW